MCFWGTGKNRYQLEIPESALARNTPSEYELQSSKKGFKRYWSPEIVKLSEELTDAEDRRDACLKDTMRKVFHQFDARYETVRESLDKDVDDVDDVVDVVDVDVDVVDVDDVDVVDDDVVDVVVDVDVDVVVDVDDVDVVVDVVDVVVDVVDVDVVDVDVDIDVVVVDVDVFIFQI
jgi:hypothetical protein